MILIYTKDRLFYTNKRSIFYVNLFYVEIFIFITASLITIPIKIHGDEVRHLIVVNDTNLKPPKNTKYCLEKPCGENAECFSGKQIRYCSCRCGFYGDPLLKCEFLLPSKIWRGELAISNPIPVALINVSKEDLYSVLKNFIEKKKDSIAMGLTAVPSSLLIGDIEYMLDFLVLALGQSMY